MTQFVELENFAHIGFWLKCYHEYRVLVCHCVGCFVYFFELGYAHRLNVMGGQLVTDVLFWYVWGDTF